VNTSESVSRSAILGAAERETKGDWQAADSRRPMTLEP
jgi:hypothetical protein